MQITINVPDSHIAGALAAPHSRYWARSADWYPKTATGSVVDLDGNRFPLSRVALATALVLMAERHAWQFSHLMNGTYDGPTGDILLQLMAFEEVIYG